MCPLAFGVPKKAGLDRVNLEILGVCVEGAGGGSKDRLEMGRRKNRAIKTGLDIRNRGS